MRSYSGTPAVIVAPQPDSITHYNYTDMHSTNETHITSNSTVHIITNHPEALNPASDTSTSSDDVQRAMYAQHQQDQLDQQNQQQAEPSPPEEAQPLEEPAAEPVEQPTQEQPAENTAEPEASPAEPEHSDDNNQ
jgi:hypothetical protein